VPAEEETRRIVPVVRRLAAEADVMVSIDTMKADVAAAAIDAGASLVNDVSAGRADARMLEMVSDKGVGLVLMHMQGTPATMQENPQYGDVVDDVGRFLVERVDAAVAAGIPRERLFADPGIGFGKTATHNWELLARLNEIAERLAGVPVLVGTSRKGFLGTGLGGLPVGEREEATLATVVWAFDHGASMVRVHDVVPAVTAARVQSGMAGAA
jgi:dihydropteroate synthase